MSVIGAILRVAYRLNRHYWGIWPLSRWMGLLLVAAGITALIRFWPQYWLALLFAGLFFSYITVMIWAARRRYVHFEASPHPPRESPEYHPLPVEELVPLRASGYFAVEGRSQYYVDIEADFETVGTREHILLGRVYPSRFLLLGQWPGEELGWWYIFAQPALIRTMAFGHLHFGRRPRLALQVTYAVDEENEETIFLTARDRETLERIWGDLLYDAPSEVVSDGLPGSWATGKEVEPS